MGIDGDGDGDVGGGATVQLSHSILLSLPLSAALLNRYRQQARSQKTNNKTLVSQVHIFVHLAEHGDATRCSTGVANDVKGLTEKREQEREGERE